MKYRMRIVMINNETYDSRDIEKDFINPQKANEEMYKLIDSERKENEFVSFKRIIPVAECDCGEEIECLNFTNTCECGRDYNFTGSLLADRSQWGQETGEHWSECY